MTTMSDVGATGSDPAQAERVGVSVDHRRSPIPFALPKFS